MNRVGNALAIAGSTLALTGCGSAAKNEVIDAGVLPQAAPAEVLTQQPNVVRFKYGLIEVVREADESGVSLVRELPKTGASGIRISEDLYVTAGHLFKDANGKMLKDITSCGAVALETESEQRVGVYYGIDQGITRAAAELDDSSSRVAHDIALVQSIDNSNNIAPATPLKIAQSQPQPGDAVYMLNYEPSENGSLRSPHEAYVENVRRDTKPAIIGGLVMRAHKNQYEVVVNIKGYGIHEDKMIRAGASGGAVLNAKGELAGITATIDAPKSIGTFENDYKVKLKNLDTDLQPALTGVQPITSHIVSKLRKKLAKVKSYC